MTKNEIEIVETLAIIRDISYHYITPAESKREYGSTKAKPQGLGIRVGYSIPNSRRGTNEFIIGTRNIQRFLKATELEWGQCYVENKDLQNLVNKSVVIEETFVNRKSSVKKGVFVNSDSTQFKRLFNIDHYDQNRDITDLGSKSSGLI